MPNLEAIEKFNQAAEGYKPADRSNSKSSVVRTNYAQNVHRRLRGLDNRPESLFGAVVSYNATGANLPLLDRDKGSMDRAKKAAFDSRGSSASNKESSELFSTLFYNGVLTDRERVRLKAILAREQAFKASVGELRPIMEAVKSQDDHFSISPEDGRFLLAEEIERKPTEYNPRHLFGVKDLLLDIPQEVEHLSSENQAKLVVDYLVSLTRRHTSDAVLDDKFTIETQSIIMEHLNKGRHLQFSVFLSMEKFANPFDTKDSHIDFGELQIALEMGAFISNIERITGKKPTLTVMNESPINQQFTHASEPTYRTEFLELLQAFGLQDQIEFVNFDFGFFKEYLQNRGHSPSEAGMLTAKIFNVMQEAYFAIHERKVKKDTVAKLADRSRGGEDTKLPKKIASKLGIFLEDNFEILVKEAEQAVQTESNKSTDPSLLFPRMSEALWNIALDKTEASGDIKDIKGSLRHLIIEQAKAQGIFFKALMKMRYAFREVFGDPVLPSEIIPLSITNAPNKWSVPFGRYPKTGIVIDGKEVAGVGPQHGVGVINNGRIVSIPWDVVAKNPDAFHPTVINLGETQVNGYIHTKKGVVVDLDDTLKRSGQAISSEAFNTMRLTMNKGEPFGIATGRGQQSIQEIVRKPFKRFLEDNGFTVAGNLLYISGNHGAWASIGVDNPQLLYEFPLDMQHILNLPQESLLKKLVEAYINGPVDLNRLQKIDAYDKYCLYFEEHLLPQALERLELENTTLNTLAATINKELKQSKVPIKAMPWAHGIDIVSIKASKGLSLSRYRNHYREVTGTKLHTNDILSVGDNPEGNDYELLTRPSGNSEITRHGPEEVIVYINENLNNNVK